jgi:hypothetical protein
MFCVYICRSAQNFALVSGVGDVGAEVDGGDTPFSSSSMPARWQRLLDDLLRLLARAVDRGLEHEAELAPSFSRTPSLPRFQPRRRGRVGLVDVELELRVRAAESAPGC